LGDPSPLEGSEPDPAGEPRRLAALVALLTDESARIREPAEAALRAAKASPEDLRSIAEAIDDPGLRARARSRLEALRTQGLEQELRELADKRWDLETGAFLLARFHYPELDVSAYTATLDRMADELRERLARLGGRETASELRRFLHDERGFKGNVEAYNDPENVFLNRVLDRRVGIPTSLACIYLLLGRRLGVPLEGVNLPLHFLVRWADAAGETFIDAFARGRFLTRTDCRDFLRAGGFEAKPEFLGPATDRQILSRLVRCLIASFRSCGAQRAAERYERCLAIVGDSSEGPAGPRGGPHR
jgi:regulator of sirC expression with transglutaminase-like and TPR domain